MESDRAIPLIETALEYFRSEKILPPTLVQIEKLVWVVLRLAERRVTALLTRRLTIGQKQQLDGLLMSEQRRGGRSRLSWLRQAPGEASPKSVTKIVERIFAMRDLELPPLPTELHQNRLLQLARKCAKYEAAPLQRMAAPRRYSLLIAYLHELSQDLTLPSRLINLIVSWQICSGVGKESKTNIFASMPKSSMLILVF